MSGQSRPPCAGLWNTPMVHVDGTVTTCCLDEHFQNALGNIREQCLAELWYGERIQRWRLAQIRGDFTASGPFCSLCNWRSAGAFPPEKVAEYLARCGLAPGDPAPEEEPHPGGAAHAVDE